MQKSFPENFQIGRETIWLNTISSTNDLMQNYAENGANEGLVIRADAQKSGKGQGNHKWISTPGLNLLMSVLLYPEPLAAVEAFIVSKMATIAVVATLKDYGLTTHIKWPNDIYASNRKMGGILIENQMRGNLLKQTILGIGININQAKFDELQGEATSFFLEKKQHIEVALFCKDLCLKLNEYYKLLFTEPAWINANFNENLLFLGQKRKFKVDQMELEGTIQAVDDQGRLVVAWPECTQAYMHKSISYIWN